MKILVFGAGAYGKRLHDYIIQNTQDEFVGFLDNDASKKGKLKARIYLPSELDKLIYDEIIVSNVSPKQIIDIKKQLFDGG